MGFAHDERAHLRARIDRELGRGGFGSWETRFLRDMHRKLGRAGTRFSDKQSRKLHEVLSRSRIRHSHAPIYSAGRRRTRHRRFRSWRDLPLLLLVMIMSFALHQLSLNLIRREVTPAASLSRQFPADQHTAIPGSIRVIDGDTVDVRGEHFRLVGLNTPETFEPRCAAELALGTRAKERLLQLLATGSPRLEKVPCACPPGTEGTQHCNFGRSCGVLSVDGRDVATTLIGEGLAVAFRCGTTYCPPLPRPWCG